MLYTHAVAALVSAAMAAAAAWGVQGWRMDARLAALQTQYATQQAQAVEKAHAETIRLQTQADAAARQHAARAAALAHDLRRTDAAVGLLHDAANAAIAAAQTSHSTCQRVAAASTTALEQCSGKYRDVAAAADAASAEAVMLRQAWPTSTQP